MKIQIDWKWLAGTLGIAVIGLLTYFATQYMNKIDRIDEKFQIIVDATETTKKIKEEELPAIKNELSAQKTILLTLAVGAKGQMDPKLQELLDRLIRSSVKAEMEGIHAAIAKVQTTQAGLQESFARLTSQVGNLSGNLASISPKTEIAAVKHDLARLSALIEKQQKLTLASPVTSWLTPEGLRQVKDGQVVTVPGLTKGEMAEFVVKDRTVLLNFSREVAETYKALGLERLPTKTKTVQ